jgi:Uma2 family endonuclease
MSVLTKPRPIQLREPDAMPLPPDKRLTYTQFHDRASRGEYGDGRFMLIRGEVREMEPMNPPHVISCDLVGAWMRSVFGEGCYVREDKPLCLELDTDPRPDFFVVDGTIGDRRAAHPTSSRFVVEIADTTLSMDLGEKKVLYAQGKVPDYWVLDLNRRRLHVFRDPACDTYTTHLTLSETDTLPPLAKPDATIAVADLLP